MVQFVLVAACACAILLDLLPRLPASGKKMGWTYGVILATALVLLFLESFGVHVPNPIQPLQTWIEHTFRIQ